MGGVKRIVRGVATGGLSEVQRSAPRGAIGRAVEDTRVAKRTALEKSIKENKIISDETRNELLSGLESASLSDISKKGSIFAEAKKGTDPKFKSRQFLQEQRNIQKDRPGRRQTILGSFTNRASGGTIASEGGK